MRTASVLILLATLEAACSSSGPLKAMDTSTDSATVPKSFAQHIESLWTGASVAARDTSPCSPGPEASGADAQGVYLAGDFDGDGARDLAVPVKRDDGVHVVVGLQHTYEYTVVDVTEKADASADRFTVRSRGTRYKVPGSDVDYYFGADTIVLTPCGGTPTAYLWTGMRFDPQPLAK